MPNIPHTLHLRAALQFALCGTLSFIIAISTAPSFAQSPPDEQLRLGRGTTATAAWQPTGTLIAVGGNGGLWLYDDHFHLHAHLDDRPIEDVAWRSDGHLLAASGPHGTTIWDIATQTPLATLDRACFRLAWQPEGTQLACADHTGALHLWDSASNAIRRIYQHAQPVTALAWRPDGSQLASSDTTGEIHVWDVTTAHTEARLQTHTPTTTALAWGPRGRLFSVTGGYLFTWRVTTGQDIRDLEPVADLAGLMDVATSPDGALLAALSAEQLLLLEAETLSIRQSIPLQTDNPFPPEQPLRVGWSADGTHVLVTRLAEVVMVRWANATTVATLETHTAAVNALAWSSDGRWIASAHGDLLGRGGNRVRIWDAASGALQAVCRGHRAAVNTLDWSADGDRLVSSSHGINSWHSAVLVHAAPTCALLAAHEPQGAAFAAAWNANGDVVLQDGGALEVWDRPLGTRMAAQEIPQQRCCSAFALDATGTQLAVGLTRGTTDNTPAIQIRDAASLSLLRTLSTPTSGVIIALAWKADGSLLASGSTDRTITLWDVRSGVPQRTLSTHTEAITALAWQPHATRIASADEGGTVRLWDAETGHVLAVWAGANVELRALAWSPDGELLAAGYANGTVRLWGVPTEEE